MELFLGVSKLLFETLEFENISQFVLSYDRAAIGEYFVRSISDFSLQKILSKRKSLEIYLELVPDFYPGIINFGLFL